MGETVTRCYHPSMSRFTLIKNLDRPSLDPIQVKYCDSFLSRLRGYTFRHKIDRDEGLLLVHPRDGRLDTSIHMLGVWFDLSIVWINAGLVVVDKVLARRWRPAYFPQKPAKYILEIHAERWDDFRVGDQVWLKDA